MDAARLREFATRYTAAWFGRAAITAAAQGFMTAGMLSLAAGQLGPGFALLKRASAAEPFFVPPHFTLGRLYEQSGFVEEAIEEYRSFLRLAPRTMAAQMTAVRARLAGLGAPAPGH